MRFESPWALLIILLIPLFVWLQARHRGKGSLMFSTTLNAARAGRSLRQRLLVLPLFLRLAALILMAVALARPQQGKEQVRDLSKGIAIEMVVDRSGSMRAEMEYEGQQLTRLEVVKKVFQQFVSGDGRTLKGRSHDLIGMIAFARYADTVCPLTLAHGALAHFLENVQLVQRRSEDGTAIGDAVALAAARLKNAEEQLVQQSGEAEGQDNYEIKSKIIILLTDGENNAGKRSVEEAAKLAAEWGIKVYAIGIGGDESVFDMQTIFGRFKSAMRGGFDDSTLKQIAAITGGFYRSANDAESLRAIYHEIDQMERTEIESVRYMDYKEMFLPFASSALILLLLEVVLQCTVLRRTP